MWHDEAVKASIGFIAMHAEFVGQYATVAVTMTGRRLAGSGAVIEPAIAASGSYFVTAYDTCP